MPMSDESTFCIQHNELFYLLFVFFHDGKNLETNYSIRNVYISYTFA